MLKINVEEVLRHADEERKKPKPLPKIVFNGKEKDKTKQCNDTAGGIDNLRDVLTNITIQRTLEEAKTDLVSKCWHEFNELKIERNQLASQTWRMVEDGATTQDLKAHYEKIESFRPQLAQLFDSARHAERYGELPQEVKSENGQAVDITSLKYEKKKLTEKRSKLKAKIEKGRATQAPKLLEWELKLDRVEAEYDHLDERIKKMEGK